MKSIYCKEPVEVISGVPIFVDRNNNSYVENYDLIASHHIDSMIHGNGNPFMEEEIWGDLEKNTIELIGKFAKPNDMILDVGVGTGRLLSRFSKMQRHGIDVAIGYLERLEDSGIECAVAVVEDLPYKDNVFDIIVCTDVLEHVFDFNRAVMQLSRVLKPGGVLIIRVPYKESLKLYLDDNYPYRVAHVQNFDEHVLEIQLCRIFEFVLFETRFDKAFVPVSLSFPLPRGKTVITKLLANISRKMPYTKGMLQKLYRPTEITMAFKKPSA